MALRKNGCCNSDKYCEPSGCYTYSSGMIYDGESIPDAGVRHGDTLNNVIANLASYVSRDSSVNGEVVMESFRGISGIRLAKQPTDIIQVSYGGVILPKEYYKAEGKSLRVIGDLCVGDGLGNTQVIYKVKSDSAFSVGC